ncbi:hypothetical protein [Nocardia sp. NPDC050435]|uniref:hypothetical protein n=1 Tax=Nocardia sp. NPDC050435 TaxID=3155040 RepID=UPI0033EBAC60
MDIIVHLVCLHPDTDAGEFETWVREVDYRTCPKLPSVHSFSVQRTERPGHYFEIIQVTSTADFENDMQTAEFKGLAAAFDAMARVTNGYAGERLEPGYTRVQSG